MYNDAMKLAFRSLQGHSPRGFFVDLIDNDNFITIRINSESLLRLEHDEKRRAVEYVYRVKEAFEDLGANVLVTRLPIDTPPNLGA